MKIAITPAGKRWRCVIHLAEMPDKGSVKGSCTKDGAWVSAERAAIGSGRLGK